MHSMPEKYADDIVRKSRKPAADMPPVFVIYQSFPPAN